MKSERGSLREFLEDIAPFFYRRSVSYVDVGAFTGEVFKALLKSGLKIREAHLIEPNPESVQELQQNIEGLFGGHSLTVHSVALGAVSGTARLRMAKSMSRITASPDVAQGSVSRDDNTVDVPCTTLDDIAEQVTERHISLLKIDVEGFEVQVLAGASRLLAEQRADVVYIEAGMNPKGVQQSYFRDIDDVLLAHGYRLFRIYEQMHEWMDDSPFLRRVDLAYMSARFAANNPRQLTRELFESGQQIAALQAAITTGKKASAALAGEVESLRSEQRRGLGERQALEQRVAEFEQLTRSMAEQLDQTQSREKAASREFATLTAQLRENSSQRDLLSQEQTRLNAEVKSLTRKTQALRAEHQETLREVEARTKECQELRQTRTALVSEFDALRRWKERSRQRTANLTARVSELESERDGLVGSLKKSQKAIAAGEAARQRLNQRAQKEHQREARQLSNSLLTGETMAREVVLHFDILRQRELQARQEAQHHKEEGTRTRRHLSYRLGSAIVSQSQHAKDWWKIPGSVVKAVREFRRDREPRRKQPSAVATDVMAAVSDVVVIALKPQWQSVRVKDSSSQRELWGKVLSASARGTIAVEMRISTDAALPTLSLSPQADSPTMATLGEATVPLPALVPGSSVRLLRIHPKSSDFEFSLRKVRGVPCVLRLELRRDSGEASRTSPELADSSPTVAALTPKSPSEQHAISISALQATTAPAECRSVVDSHAGRVAKVRRGSDGVIWEVHTLITQGRREEGFRLAEERANELERHAIHILRANERIADDAEWLTCLNQYVQQFGIAPIRLASSDRERFLRLCAHEPTPVERGPLVSVIMPAFNSERTLRFAAESILRQSWRPLELIIVDDASTDATLSIAQNLARNDSRVRLLRHSVNLGPYLSKNFGLQIAQGAYVTGHDADDWAHPERIQRHIEAMLRDGGRIQASLSKMLRLTYNGTFSNIGRNTPNVDDGVLQTAFISCMLEMAFFRSRLGHWDSVRFGADSELISRTRQILGDRFTTYRQLGMLCLDSEAGLTNDPVHGVSRSRGMSPTRAEYRNRFMAWHALAGERLPVVPLPHDPRMFEAPAATLVSPEAVRSVLAKQIEDPVVALGAAENASSDLISGLDVDVCIVTSLAFPGGNASSTLEEVRALLGAGLTVRVVHCPEVAVPKHGRSARFDPIAHLCVDAWKDDYRITCRLLIARHPVVICGPKFLPIVDGIQASSAVFVVNNSMYRADGSEVFSPDELNFVINSLPYPDKYVCPLGPAIREELMRDRDPELLPIADLDWFPTFSTDALALRPLRPFGSPVSIGRHSRDGQEKWPEDVETLLEVYPDSPNIRVRILGGARYAAKTMGQKARHWEVLPFGSITPGEFLRDLDVFVYFPNSNLNEAFGRAVMEAVFVGVPCVLPTRMEPTFGATAIYCAPSAVQQVVSRLARSQHWCRAFTERARAIALSRYESKSVLNRVRRVSPELAARLDGMGVAPVAEAEPDVAAIARLNHYVRWVTSGVGDESRYVGTEYCPVSAG